MEIRRFQDVEEFRGRAWPLLIEHEAANNLIFGITAGLSDGSARYDGPPYLVTVDDDASIVAAAMRTPPYSVVLSTGQLEAIPLIASDLHSLSPDLPGVNGPSTAARAFANLFRHLSGRRYVRATTMRIYQLEHVVPVSGVPGELRRATMEDRDVALAWGRAFNADTTGSAGALADERILGMLGGASDRALFLWDDGGPVSLCGFSGPTPNGIRVSFVYTPPHLRGRGYASAAVAALSQYILDSGRRFCFLYTDLRNPTSNRIYQRIGYEPVIDADEYLFEPKSS